MKVGTLVAALSLTLLPVLGHAAEVPAGTDIADGMVVHMSPHGVHFMALEYVEGRNLRDYLAKKGPPELLLALSIMRQVAAGLPNKT